MLYRMAKIGSVMTAEAKIGLWRFEQLAGFRRVRIVTGGAAHAERRMNIRALETFALVTTQTGLRDVLFKQFRRNG